MPSSRPKDLTALVTGASEGIGYELAKVMAKDGWDLVLTARREKLLTELTEDLTTRFGVKCYYIAADLADPNGVESILKFLTANDIRIDVLINNAGFGYYGLFAGQDSLRLRDMVEVNISSLVTLTNSLLPSMIERKQGWVMNVGSVASFQPIPTSAVYAASKAFVLSFSEALATELEGTDVSVTCLCPGVTRTGFAREAGAKHLDTDFRGVMSAKEVAAKGYRAMMAEKRTFVTGGVNAFLAFCTRFVPRSLASKVAQEMMKRRIPK